MGFNLIIMLYVETKALILSVWNQKTFSLAQSLTNVIQWQITNKVTKISQSPCFKWVRWQGELLAVLLLRLKLILATKWEVAKGHEPNILQNIRIRREKHAKNRKMLIIPIGKPSCKIKHLSKTVRSKRYKLQFRLVGPKKGNHS